MFFRIHHSSVSFANHGSTNWYLHARCTSGTSVKILLHMSRNCTFVQMKMWLNFVKIMSQLRRRNINIFLPDVKINRSSEEMRRSEIANHVATCATCYLLPVLIYSKLNIKTCDDGDGFKHKTDTSYFTWITYTVTFLNRCFFTFLM